MAFSPDGRTLWTGSTDGTVNLTLTSMHVPEPVIHYTIKLTDRKGEQNLSKALQRFTKEDPTFRAKVDGSTAVASTLGLSA